MWMEQIEMELNGNPHDSRRENKLITGTRIPIHIYNRKNKM